MAYRIPNKTVQDQSARTAVGVSIPFSKLFNITYTTKDATKSNLINYLLTNKGERPLNPLFGSNISRTVFEPVSDNTLAGLENIIKEDIELFFPLVKVESLNITPSPDENLIKVILKYSVLNSPTDEIEINFNTEQ